jgi:hypothetical protein
MSRKLLLLVDTVFVLGLGGAGQREKLRTIGEEHLRKYHRILLFYGNFYVFQVWLQCWGKSKFH